MYPTPPPNVCQMHPLSPPRFMPSLFLFIVYWLQILLPIYLQVWGHQLGHGQPTGGHPFKNY